VPALAATKLYGQKGKTKMAKFMTKEQREKISNRLLLNFGILLAGALVMLYVYNFANAGYNEEVAIFMGVAACVSAVAAIVMFVLGKVKYPNIKNYSAIFLGMFLAGAITYASQIKFVRNMVNAYTVKNAAILVLLLMLVYFIVMAIITAITLKTHPEAPSEKKKIQHAKKKKKKR